MRTEFLPDAEKELLEAAHYYEAEAPGVGMAFTVEVIKAASQIAAQPLSAPKIRGSLRKKVVKHFPYSIIYSVVKDVIVIIALAHHKRKPQYWRRRAKSPLT